MTVDRSRVEALTRELLLAIGEDPERAGLKRTPERVAELFAELYGGVGADAAVPLRRTISVSHGPAPDTMPTGPVIVRDIEFRSVCEHHLLPFSGRAHIAYEPRDQVVGLGALVEVVEILSCRPQVQERLGEQIAETIQTQLDPAGVVVVLSATHGCVTSRGARQAASSTVTVAARGTLADPVARAEIMGLLTE